MNALSSGTEKSFYRDLVMVMTNPAFQNFCSDYMSSWSDMETSCMYIKLYQALSQYLDAPTDVISVIDRIMHNAPARRKTIQCFRRFQQGGEMMQAMATLTQQHEKLKGKNILFGEG